MLGEWLINGASNESSQDNSLMNGNEINEMELVRQGRKIKRIWTGEIWAVTGSLEWICGSIVKILIN